MYKVSIAVEALLGATKKMVQATEMFGETDEEFAVENLEPISGLT